MRPPGLRGRRDLPWCSYFKSFGLIHKRDPARRAVFSITCCRNCPWSRTHPGGMVRDDRHRPGGCDALPDMVGIIGRISEHHGGSVVAQQRGGLGRITALPGGQQETHRARGHLPVTSLKERQTKGFARG